MRMRALILVAVVGLAMSCNSKNLRPGYCKSNADCPGSTCDSHDGGTFMCAPVDGGMDGGKTDGGSDVSVDKPFRCDASSQCGSRDGAAPFCAVEASSCVGCLIDGDCTDTTKPICGADHTCRPCSTATNTECLLHVGKTVCSAGSCVECAASTDCKSAPTKPICGTDNTCRACQADSECVNKDATAPGVCMSHQDGRCATSAETIYVKFTSSSCPSTNRTGTLASPFCGLEDARIFVSNSSNVDLAVIVGPSAVPPATSLFSPSNAQMEFSFIGQGGATISGGVYSGIHISGSRVYVRGIVVTGSTNTPGIVAETSSTLRLEGVTISGNSGGGLQLTGSAYDITNSIFAGNGSGTLSGGASFGGAYLGTPPGSPSRFDFNTVTNNGDRGVVCQTNGQQINASLFSNNMGPTASPDVGTNCVLASSQTTASGNPLLSATYRLTMNSPCKDFVTTVPANPPAHDIDGVSRPQGTAYDCGASEFKP